MKCKRERLKFNNFPFGLGHGLGLVRGLGLELIRIKFLLNELEKLKPTRRQMPVTTVPASSKPIRPL